MHIPFARKLRAGLRWTARTSLTTVWYVGDVIYLCAAVGGLTNILCIVYRGHPIGGTNGTTMNDIWIAAVVCLAAPAAFFLVKAARWLLAHFEQG